MAKKAAGKRTQRITTHKPNGATSMEVAPGPPAIVLPSPDEAVKVLERLGKINEEAGAALRRYEDLKQRTKDAKDEYDGIMVLIGVVIDKATHEAPMPLFDAKQREEDQARMEESIGAVRYGFSGKEILSPEGWRDGVTGAIVAPTAGQDAPETTNGLGGDPAPVPTVDVVPEALPPDSEVF